LVGSIYNTSYIIANNLKLLGYERILAVSRLNDIPKKVLNVLGQNKVTYFVMAYLEIINY